MVSTELLRRYPFFAGLSDGQLRELAMISAERVFQGGATVFESETAAKFLYLLRSGSIELHYVVTDQRGMEIPQDYLVGMINPWEVFGISAVVAPYQYTSSAITGEPSTAIEIESYALRALCDADLEMKVLFQERIAATAFKRLQDARVQLLAV